LTTAPARTNVRWAHKTEVIFSPLFWQSGGRFCFGYSVEAQDEDENGNEPEHSRNPKANWEGKTVNFDSRHLRTD
jgi:hypothetical protein